MSSIKFTLGSVFNMVAATANAGTSSITSLAKGADMLAAFVDKQAMEQAYAYKLEHKVFKETKRVELSLSLAQSAESIDKLKAKSESFSNSFNHFYDLLGDDKPE